MSDIFQYAPKGPPRRNSPLKNYSQNEDFSPDGFPKKKKKKAKKK